MSASDATVLFWCVVVVFVCVWFGCFVVSLLFYCKYQSSLTSFFIYTALGDRQCFHARSARQKKKKGCPP